MASLTSKAPTFDGSEEVMYWLRSMRRHFRRNDVVDEHMQIEVIIGALRGTAKTWFSSLDDDDCDFDSIHDVCRAFEQRFGKTEM